MLTSRTGTALVRGTTDAIGNQLKTWNKRHDIAKADRITFAKIRRLCDTTLESNPTHARFGGLLLGHAPASIREKHYAAPDEAGFAEAVAWLRGEILGDV